MTDRRPDSPRINDRGCSFIAMPVPQCPVAQHCRRHRYLVASKPVSINVALPVPRCPVAQHCRRPGTWLPNTLCLVYTVLYLDKGSQSLWTRWAIWGHSTLLLYCPFATWDTWDPSTFLLFATLRLLGALGGSRLYCYALDFGHKRCQRSPNVVQRGSSAV